MPTIVFLLQCTNALCNGLVTKLRLFLGILPTSLHRQNQILTNELSVYQERLGRKISSKLPIMRFHQSKQSVLMDRFADDGKLG